MGGNQGKHANNVTLPKATPAPGVEIADSVDDLLRRLPSNTDSVPIIVLGQSLQPDGQPSPVLLNRVKLSAELHARTKAPLLVSGGDVAGVGETEASIMYRLLVEAGVASPKTSIFRDDRAFNTLENAKYIAPMLTSMGSEASILVTSEFHLPRATLLFEGVFAHLGLADLRLLGIGADGGHSRLPARVPSPMEKGGPREDISKWRLSERCQHEHRLLSGTMQKWFQQAGIPCPSESRFQLAKQQLQMIA